MAQFKGCRKRRNNFVYSPLIGLHEKLKILSAIKDNGLQSWKENIRLLDSLKRYDLPLPIRTRNGQLRKYCELRIKSYELICKSIQENTSVYDMEINDCNQQIEHIINLLTNNQK